ncbi:hypothetical protein AB0H77_26930 [Streptomyces sp. NPDC050844]|uniref:hypothetical protein n=1 Tax=Streptomyces sp. NPDC050844 TaxID=3155790 RepID=UPI0033C0CD90
MPKPIPMNRLTWGVVWAAGLSAVGLAVTAGLNASSAPDPSSEKPVSAECAQYIEDIERQLAKARQEGEEDGVLAFSRVRGATGDDCREALRNHFGGDG